MRTLEGITYIDGYEVNHKGYHNSPNKFIVIDHDNNDITFRLQNGPVKEKGVNGCQIDTMIATALIIMENLNKDFPCRENSIVITKLDEALMWLDVRKKDREIRGVEGTNSL